MHEGVLPEDLRAKALATAPSAARFIYLLPNFQNPTGRTMSEARRAAVSAAAMRNRRAGHRGQPLR
jgi:2-aminoadipate transaminase